MTPSRPYLIRALYDWIVDNNLTPYLLVDAAMDGVDVPREHVKDDKIILNVAPHAVDGMALGNDNIAFGARFANVPRQVVIPTQAVKAIYAKENGQGMMFSEDDDGSQPPEPPGTKRTKPRLKLVK